MADYVNFKTALGMTDHQVLDEILTMREFDKVVKENADPKQYHSWCLEAARRRSLEFLQKLGATSEEAEDICDLVEESFRKEEEND